GFRRLPVYCPGQGEARRGGLATTACDARFTAEDQEAAQLREIRVCNGVVVPERQRALRRGGLGSRHVELAHSVAVDGAWEFFGFLRKHHSVLHPVHPDGLPTSS